MKCFLCGIEEGVTEEMGKNHYCPSCYKIAKKEEKHRKSLIGYICKIFDMNRPNGMMFAQMKNFKEKDGISYQHQLWTLKFLHEIQKMPLEKKYGIGIIKYRYADMMEYKTQKDYEEYLKKKEIEKNKQVDNSVKTVQTKVIKRKNYIEENLLDIDDFLIGGKQ